MSKQQLYINDVAVDMPADEIKIKVESNLFSDASKIMTAHSYNIALPRTMTNDSIFANAFVPAADTGGKSTHRYLKASLYVDGVPLFTGGKAVLSAVDEKGYKMNLFWGIIGVFDNIKAEDLNLNELAMSTNWDESTMATWAKVTQDMAGDVSGNIELSGMNADIYSTLDSDSKALVDTMPWTLPVVSANDILTKISQVYGVTFTLSPYTQQRIDKLYHPLTTRRAMCEDERLTMQMGMLNRRIENKYHLVYYTPPLDGQGMRNYSVYSPFTMQFAAASNKPIANDAVVFEDDGVDTFYKANRELAIKSIRVQGSCSIQWRAICMLTDIVSQRAQNSHYNSGTGYWELDYTWENVKAEQGDYIMQAGYIGEPSTLPAHSSIYFTIEFEKIDELVRGDWYCIERNYPEMKIIDYLSEILVHTGSCIIGSVADAKELQIVTFDEIAERSSISYDTQGVRTITMAWDGLAQKNKYTHKENDDTGEDFKYTGEGIIYTEDDTITKERDAFKSDFKVPRLALVRLWAVEKNEQGATYKATWKGSGDYICGLNSITATFMNTGQDFERTLANYYADYQAMARRPKMVDAEVRMSVLELMAVDFTRPVYLPQVGRKYMVVSVENSSDDTYKLKLIQV